MRITVCLFFACFWSFCNGHGYLLDPPSRSSAWRFGFRTPKNYDDNGLNCGGTGVQHHQNGGKCGPCGDNWSLKTPRPNEYGGMYGKGVIVKQYKKNQTIDIKVQISANHLGWFEFRVCEDYMVTDQTCLDKNVLYRADDPTQTKYYIGRKRGPISVKYNLPENFQTEHGILQWFYNAGNNWGTCENGTSAVGCGSYQENFKNCADISVL